jgi:hypothetical protein
VRKFPRLARADRTLLHNQLACQFTNRQKSIGDFENFVDSARIEGNFRGVCSIIGHDRAIFRVRIMLRRKVNRGDSGKSPHNRAEIPERRLRHRGFGAFTIFVNGKDDVLWCTGDGG